VVRFTRTAAAERDLSEIWEYIAVDSETAADKTLRETDAQCHVLGQYPKMGWDCSDIVPGVRSFPVGNYLIFYREISQGVEIIRVLHGARNLDFIDFDSNIGCQADSCNFTL
jgi:toxin ParE1/3/4